ncbi:hypothetical protein, partial [Gordonia sp. YY1]
LERFTEEHTAPWLLPRGGLLVRGGSSRRVCEVDIAASAPHSQSSAHNIEGGTIMAEAIVGAIITDIVGELVTGSIESGSDEATA